MIRENSLIHGTSGEEVTHKTSIYADGIILYVSDPLILIPTLLNCLRNFGFASGYRVNEKIVSFKLEDSDIWSSDNPTYFTFVQRKLLETKYSNKSKFRKIEDTTTVPVWQD